MSLDLSSLKKAVTSYKTALTTVLPESKLKGQDIATTSTLKAGIIQNFEFTYELCWKFIQRWLNENEVSSDEILLPRTRKDLFRIAAKHGLIDDPLKWFEYSTARNLTAHTYSQETAEVVFSTAIKFIVAAESLLLKLEANND